MQVGQRVIIKLREPVGSATTETANHYLRNFAGRIGQVYEVCESPERTTYRVWFPAEAGKYINEGIFNDHELQKVEL